MQEIEPGGGRCVSEPTTYDDEGTLRLPISWESYDSLEYDDSLRGAEYMDGELLVPSGLSDYGHQKAIRYLERQIEPTLTADEDVISGFGWKPTGASEEYGPDVMVCTVPTDRRRFTGVPLLCVEITSTNWTADLVRKRAKYAAAGLPDYWIVDRRGGVLRCLELRDRLLVETEDFVFDPKVRQTVTATYGERTVDLELARLFL